MALANRTTIDDVDYARSGPPGLARLDGDAWLAAGFVGTTAWLGDAGMAPFVSVAAVMMGRRCLGLVSASVAGSAGRSGN